MGINDRLLRFPLIVTRDVDGLELRMKRTLLLFTNVENYRFYNISLSMFRWYFDGTRSNVEKNHGKDGRLSLVFDFKGS